MTIQIPTLTVPATQAGRHDIPWPDAMGSLCRISPIPNEPLLELEGFAGRPDYAAFIRQIWAFRREVYSRLYPEVSGVENDPHDRQSCVIYTQSADGRVTSTARIAFDGTLGIPEAELVPEVVRGHRRNGRRFAELGRFVIDDAARGVLPNYYRAYYVLGRAWGIEVYLMFVPDNKVSLYRRLMDAKVVVDFEGLTFGGSHPYVCMEWWLDDTLPRFFNWCGAKPKHRANGAFGVSGAKWGVP